MKEDKLDNLLVLLKKNSNSYHSDVMHMLYALQSNYEAFLYFYENLSKEDKPNFLDKDLSYFAKVFFKIICHLDNARFNSYFFQGFHEIIDVLEIREQALKRQDNKELQEFLNKNDNPKNLDKIIELLASVHNEDNNKFDSLVLKYKEQLKKINTMNAPKSRTLDYLYHWFNYELEHKGLMQVILLADKLGYDLHAPHKNNKRKLKFYNYRFTFKEQDVLALNLLFERNKDKSKYNVLKSLTDLENPIKTTIGAADVSKELAKYFWDIYETYLKNIINEKDPCGLEIVSCVNYQSAPNLVLTDVFEVLIVLLQSTKCKNYLSIYDKYGDTEESTRVYVKSFQKVVFDILLDIKEVPAVKRPKI